MSDNLQNSISCFLSFLDPRQYLTELEQSLLLSHAEIISLNKNEDLIQIGNEVNFVYYLMKGIVRYYITTEDGREVTKAFYKDSFLIGSFDVTFNKIPSKFSVQTLTQATFLRIPISNIRDLLESSHSFSKVYNRFITSVFIFKEKREIELLSTTAAERYAKFLEEFPEIADEISASIIASYIGVTPIQLSRIKNK